MNANRHLENPVRIIRVGTKFVVINENGDHLSKADSHFNCLRWCWKNHCAPVFSFKRMQILQSFLVYSGWQILRNGQKHKGDVDPLDLK